MADDKDVSVRSCIVLAVSVSPQSGHFEVRCSSLSGSLFAEGRFATDSRLSELEAQVRQRLSQEGSDSFTVSMSFLGNDGKELSKAEPLKDLSTFSVKTDIVQLKEFVSAFNNCKSSKEVQRVMEDAGLSPDSAGRLVHRTWECLSLQLLGECIGNHKSFWVEFAMRFPENFTSFKGMDIVQAIRAYLWCFRLPGEAAQIDRILSGFARSYFRFNAPETKESLPDAPKGKSQNLRLGDSDSDEGTDEEDGSGKRCWDAVTPGWYVCQPLSGPKQLPCCIHCGYLDGENGDLLACQGCNLVHFCRKCRRRASQFGHSVVGTLGYGRACLAAKREAGHLGWDQQITFRRDMSARIETAKVSKRSCCWERVSPFRNEDSVMVLAYAIVMLTTNLHSSKVKSKMEKHQFIKQNAGVNGSGNFPGDFLSQVYDDIQREELKVMRPVG